MTDQSEETDGRSRVAGDDLDDRLRQLEAKLAELQEARASEARLLTADGVLLDARDLVPAAPIALAAPPSGAVLHPPLSPETRPWTLAATIAEVRLLARMYFDHRYRVSRLTQFAVPVIAVLFVLNYLFFALWFPVPVVSPVLERVLCVVLGVLLYKLLARELARYREVLEYLHRNGFR